MITKELPPVAVDQRVLAPLPAGPDPRQLLTPPDLGRYPALPVLHTRSTNLANLVPAKLLLVLIVTNYYLGSI